MNKKFLNVNTLLNVEGLDESDSKVVLTTAQLQVIDDKLVELQGKVENHGNLEKQFTDKLDKFSEEVKSIEGIDNKIAKIKQMFDKIPSPATPSANTPDSHVDEYADIRKDPINNFYDE